MYSLLPFFPCASPRKANRTPQNRAGKFADCRRFCNISARCYRAVDFGFYFFRLPVGGSLGLGFLFLWLSFWFLFCLFVGNLDIM